MEFLVHPFVAVQSHSVFVHIKFLTYKRTKTQQLSKRHRIFFQTSPYTCKKYGTFGWLLLQQRGMVHVRWLHQLTKLESMVHRQANINKGVHLPKISVWFALYQRWVIALIFFWNYNITQFTRVGLKVVLILFSWTCNTIYQNSDEAHVFCSSSSS